MSRIKLVWTILLIAVIHDATAALDAQIGPCTSPIHGTFELRWSGGPVIHEAKLDLGGCAGVMTVRFFNPLLQRTEAISQRMELRSTPRGTLILGFNPVYLGTSVRHPSYAADNLLLQQDVSGRWHFENCDDQDLCSHIEVISFRPH